MTAVHVNSSNPDALRDILYLKEAFKRFLRR